MDRYPDLLRQQIQRSPWYALLPALLLFFLAQMLVGGAILPLLGQFWGFESEVLTPILQGKRLELPGARDFFRLSLFLNNLITWGLTAWLLARLSGSPSQELGLSLPRPQSGSYWVKLCLLAILGMVVAMPLVQWTYLPLEALQLPESWSGIEAALRSSEQLNREILPSLFQDGTWPLILLNLLVFALTPAVCEELFFRGYLLRQFSRTWPSHLAIWTIAALFSLIHFQALGFVSRLLLGALLGYFAVYSGTIWPSIVGHFAFNASAILGQVLVEPMPGEAIPEEVRPAWYWAFLSAGLTWLVLRFFRQYTQSTTPTQKA